jgi:hypothetical protein
MTICAPSSEGTSSSHSAPTFSSSQVRQGRNDGTTPNRHELAFRERPPAGLGSERNACREHHALLAAEVDCESRRIDGAALCGAAPREQVQTRRVGLRGAGLESPVSVDEERVAVGI